MGKKHKKSSFLRDSASNSTLNDSSSTSALNDGDTSCSSLNFSNISLDEETTVPSKFLVSTVEFAHCEKYAKCLKSQWENEVLLHPSVMISYNIEDLVLIQDENKKRILCVAYPISNVKKSLVVFLKHTFDFQPQDVVSIQAYNFKVKDAEEVFISICDERLSNDQNIKNIIYKLLLNKYIYEGLVVKWQIFDQEYEAVIKEITCSSSMDSLCSSEFYTVSYKTTMKYESHNLQIEQNTPAFSHIGGLEKQMKKLTCYIQGFLSAENSSIMALTLLLFGPSGTGKSLFLNSVCKEYNFCIEHIRYGEIYLMSQAEVIRKLRRIFETVINRAPSILIMDEFNKLCPSANDDDVKLCIKHTLKNLLRKLGNAKVLILAAANDSDYDESVLKTHERLVEIVNFGLPSSDERTDILKRFLDLRDHDLTSEQIQECAELAHGFTGRDLLSAIKNAEIFWFQKTYDINKAEDRKSFKERGHLSVKYSDLKSSIKLKKSTIVGASDLKVKKVQWSDIGGMSDIKEKFKEIIEWPLKYPETFKHFNISPPRGVLMYGPPGCSKTMIAKALSNELSMNFIYRKGSDIYNKYVGESEKNVRDMFAMAKAKSPCIIFLDEIDSLAPKRGSSSSDSGVGDRVVTSFLTEMDGIEELHGVIIIAATNRPDLLDEALIRYGRINHFIYVPLPDAETREEIFRINMRNRIYEQLDFRLLAEKTEGYSGAEIVNICNEAALLLIYEDPTAEFPTFRMDHFEEIMKHNRPNTTQEMITFYENYKK